MRPAWCRIFRACTGLIVRWKSCRMFFARWKMVDYMNSLEILLHREESIYYPGHGGPVNNAHKFVRALRAHRKMREREVLERIRAGDRLIANMVKVIYRDTDPRLHGAAALSVMAHIEDLVARALVTTSGPVAIDGEFETP